MQHHAHNASRRLWWLWAAVQLVLAALVSPGLTASTVNRTVTVVDTVEELHTQLQDLAVGDITLQGELSVQP